MEDRKITFGKRLKEAMNKKGINASQLSKATGIDRGSISRFLNKGYYPQPETMDKLVKALDVSYAWLSGVEQEVLQYLQQKSSNTQDTEDLEILELWHRLNDVQKLAVRKTIEAFLNN